MNGLGIEDYIEIAAVQILVDLVLNQQRNDF